MSHFLGLDSARGYAEIPAVGNIEFPRDHAPQLEYQVGWHFFVGSCTGKNGKEYGVEMMFWQFSLLTPAIARHFGLTDWENQVLELHLAISEAGDRHYRSPDPQQYPVTHTWYPDHWEFHFGNDVLENLRTFHMLPIVSGGQSGFFANSAQYSEGAVFLVNDKINPLVVVLPNQLIMLIIPSSCSSFQGFLTPQKCVASYFKNPSLLFKILEFPLCPLASSQKDLDENAFKGFILKNSTFFIVFTTILKIQ